MSEKTCLNVTYSYILIRSGGWPGEKFPLHPRVSRKIFRPRRSTGHKINIIRMVMMMKLYIFVFKILPITEKNVNM